MKAPYKPLISGTSMVSQSKIKLYKVDSKSKVTDYKTYRDSIFLEKTLVDNSLPFKSGDNLIAKIDKDRLVIKAENAA
jgi:hypothetical protein